MSPEFVIILEEREQVGRWFILLPISLGILSLIVSAGIFRKRMAFLYINILAISSVVVPMEMFAQWWGELSSAATTQEDADWINNHDGGGQLIGPVYATMMALIFWIIGALSLLFRSMKEIFCKIKAIEKHELDVEEPS